MAIGPDLSRATSAPWGRIVADKLQRSPQFFSIEPEDGLQAVLDSITAGRSIENPYVIGLMPGVYSGDFQLRRSNVFLTSVMGAGTAILHSTNAVDEDKAALVVGEDGSEITDVWLQGLTFVRSKQGPSGGPFPSLSIGNSDPAGGAGVAPTNWDRIVVQNCDIIGLHDGLQIFGNEITPNPDGLLTVQSCRIYSAHDAFTLKARGRIRSIGNMIFSQGSSPHPWIANADILDWKTTGIHFNAAAVAWDPLQDLFYSVGDSIYVRLDDNVSLSGAQQGGGGVYFYETGTGDRFLPRCLFSGLSVFVDWDFNGDPGATEIRGAAVGVRGEVRASDGDVVFVGCNLQSYQRNVGASAPSTIHVVENRAAGANDFVLRIVGCNLFGRNDKAAGVVQSLTTGTDANARIICSDYSEHTTLEGTAGSINPATIVNT